MNRSFACLVLALLSGTSLFAQDLRDREEQPLPARDPRANVNPFIERLLPHLLPPPQPGQPVPGQRRWRLGVNVRDTDAGVLIIEVFQGTAANRAGIEVGDIVVSVNGYQVGNVLGRVYDIADEFERRADPQGRVRFLILDARTGELVNRDINLDRRSGLPSINPLPNPQPQVVTVTGRVALRERVFLPQNGTVDVQLLDVTQPGRAELIGQQQIRGPAQSPWAFALRLDAQRVQPQGRYVVQCRVYLDRTVAWSTAAPVAVLTRGNPAQDITLTVEPVR